VTYLNDGRSSSDSVVGQGSVAAGEHDVCLSSEASRDDDRVAPADGCGWHVGWAGHGDEGGVHGDTGGWDEGVAL
jgi:hypothetical protein